MLLRLGCRGGVLRAGTTGYPFGWLNVPLVHARHQSQSTPGGLRYPFDSGELNPAASVERGRKKLSPSTLSHFYKAKIQQDRRDLGLTEVVDWEEFCSEAVYIPSKSGAMWVGADDPRCAKFMKRKQKMQRQPQQIPRKAPNHDQAKELENHPLRSFFSTPSDMNDPLTIADALSKAGMIKPQDVKYTASHIKFKPRPPIVAIMGHVDHGKTTLLDHLRRTNVAAGEAGGITQSIGAFRVDVDRVLKGESGTVEIDPSQLEKARPSYMKQTEQARDWITFIDTPGHAAFKEMRESGATATDLVLLIISAVDGVQPQTIESLEIIQQKQVPFIVVFNKIDREPNVDRHLEKLRSLNVELEEDGGDVMWVGISALTGENVPALIEMIQLQTAMQEVVQPEPARAEVLVIDSHNKGNQSVAGIVRCGELRTGATMASGMTYATISEMRDETGAVVIKRAKCGQPVLLSGFKVLPKPGVTLFQLANDSAGEKFHLLMRDVYGAEGNREAYLQLLNQERQGKIYDRKPDGNEQAVFKETPFNVSVKAQTFGQLQATMRLLYELPPLEGVQMVIRGAEVGGLTDEDVVGMMGKQQPGAVLAFGDVTHKNRLALPDYITMYECNVVYHGINYIKEKLVELMPKVFNERVVAKAIVKQTFRASQAKNGNAAGLEVTEGMLVAEETFRVRRQKPSRSKEEPGEWYTVYEGGARELRRFKEKVPTVDQGLECGMILHDDFLFQVNDVVEQIVKEVIERDVDETIEAALIEEQRRRDAREAEDAAAQPAAESTTTKETAKAA